MSLREQQWSLDDASEQAIERRMKKLTWNTSTPSWSWRQLSGARDCVSIALGGLAMVDVLAGASARTCSVSQRVTAAPRLYTTRNWFWTIDRGHCDSNGKMAPQSTIASWNITRCNLSHHGRRWKWLTVWWTTSIGYLDQLNQSGVVPLSWAQWTTNCYWTAQSEFVSLVPLINHSY